MVTFVVVYIVMMIKVTMTMGCDNDEYGDTYFSKICIADRHRANDTNKGKLHEKKRK
jgi:hypothetical protein